MNRRLAATIVSGGLALAAGGVLAQDATLAEAKAKQAGCFRCHGVGAAKVGPALREIAKKYPKQDDKIVATLKADKDHTNVVKELSDDDLKLIADWIASL